LIFFYYRYLFSGKSGGFRVSPAVPQVGLLFIHPTKRGFLPASHKVPWDFTKSPWSRSDPDFDLA
jgi:hypothetical protein